MLQAQGDMRQPVTKVTRRIARDVLPLLDQPQIQVLQTRANLRVTVRMARMARTGPRMSRAGRLRLAQQQLHLAHLAQLRLTQIQVQMQAHHMVGQLLQQGR